MLACCNRSIDDDDDDVIPWPDEPQQSDGPVSSPSLTGITEILTQFLHISPPKNSYTSLVLLTHFSPVLPATL